MILGEPIILGGGSGIPVEIIVETEPGASVLCINGATVFEKTANAGGKAVFEVKKEGTWTIQASLDGEISETEVFVEHKIEEELTFVDRVLANNSWEVISAVARAGKAREYWNIGDTKPMTVAGSTYNMQIMDFDMYDVADPTSYGRTKAGIVFQYKEVADATYEWEQSQANVDDWITNYSEVKELIPTINYPALNKYDATTVTMYQKKGINPSEQEVFGTTTLEKIAVGTQYAFYAAGNSKVKANLSGAKRAWWTRSTHKSYSTRYVYVKTIGEVSSSSTNNYSSPVFCL